MNLPAWHPAYTKTEELPLWHPALLEQPSYWFQKGWVTINGNHILMGEDGNPTGRSHGANSHIAGHEMNGAMEVGGHSFALNKAEQAFANQKDLQLLQLHEGTSRLGTFSTMNMAKPVIQLNTGQIESHGASADATFYHEFGHFVDNMSQAPVDQFSPSLLSNTKEFRSIMRAEKTAIVANRLARGTLSKKFTMAQIGDFVTGTPVKSTTGRDLFMNARHLKYLTSSAEVFSEAYGQYRTAPAMLKETAPRAYNFVSSALK